MHILSFLSTRETVQTCILSKSWRNMWASVPDLKFDIKDIGLPKDNDRELGLRRFFYDEMSVEQFVTKFELLVKSVLEKRETSCVNRLRLWLDNGVYWPWTQALADYIGDVMKLEPQECSVKLHLCENLNLNTDLIFNCASLIDLRLSLYTEVHPFVAIELNSVNLPCIKTLKLGQVTMNDNLLKKLLLGCPVLEELSLKGCYIGIIEICSNTLKKFVLRSCYTVMRLQICTPNLLYLDIYVGTRNILLLNMPLLVDASIYLIGWYNPDKYVTRGPELIHSLSNVESLQLEFNNVDGKTMTLPK